LESTATDAVLQSRLPTELDNGVWRSEFAGFCFDHGCRARRKSLVGLRLRIVVCRENRSEATLLLPFVATIMASELENKVVFSS
jgi:hypothetical protein